MPSTTNKVRVLRVNTVTPARTLPGNLTGSLENDLVIRIKFGEHTRASL